MISIRNIAIACLALTSVVWATSVDAKTTFCNKFHAAIWVAIAYPQDGGSWMSRGWMSLDPGNCAQFDSAVHTRTLFYRGESVVYRNSYGQRVRTFWGNQKKFAIWESDNFQYWDAENRVLNSSLASFSEAFSAAKGDPQVTVTFEPDGHTTTVSFR